MKKVLIKNYGIVHQLARCDTCGWINEEYVKSEARKEAIKHTLKTGHTTAVETGISRHYYLEKS